MSKITYEIPLHGKVLACVDASAYAESVADHAIWAATRLEAGLTFLHVLPPRPGKARLADYSGNIGVDTQSALLDELVALDEQHSKLAIRQGRELLQSARHRATEAGVTEPDGLQRHGSFAETLVELETDVRLFVLGKRGESADFEKGHLGANLERAVRGVHRPLLVASRQFRPINRFAIAFDGSTTTRKCVEMVAQSPMLRNLPCRLIVASEGRPDIRDAIDWACERLAEAGFQVEVARVEGEAETVIAEQIAEYAIDLLVMGAYGHSRIRHLIVGSTTTAVIRSCQIPVLLLR